jgi:hypothetical protein
MELNNSLHWGATPIATPKGGLPEAPKDNKLYWRKNGKRENVHLDEIDGGTANPDQTLIIDGGTAF